MESAAFSGSSKRARAPGNIAQVAQCLVDGCTADLSLCREYHRRHKVCESHSKTAKVSIGGREQRFCQQCSRFHSLTEFDEGKRSCRKRLDGHNRRRRKPQPESISRNPGLLFPNQQGTRLLSFGGQETYTNAFGGSTWGGVVTPDNDIPMYNNQPDLNYVFPEASTHSYKGVNQFQFIHGSEHVVSETSIRHQPLLDSTSPSGNSNCSQKIFSSDGLNHNHQVVDSDRALSLLSSAPAVSREIGLNHMVHKPLDVHHSQSLAHNLLFNSLSQYPFSQEFESKPVVSVSNSQVTDDSHLHFQELFQNGVDGSSTSGSQQTLTFMWE